MSFYLTLHGTHSKFSTHLSNSIILKGDYDVALSDINFNSDMLINFGSIRLQNRQTQEIYNVEIILHDNISVENFVNHINMKLSVYRTYTEYESFYSKRQGLCKATVTNLKQL